MSQQINLFNPIFKQQKKYFSAVTMAQALGMVLLGSVLMIAYATYRSSMLGAEAVAANQQLKTAEDQFAQVSVAFPPREKSKILEQQVQKMEAELAAVQKITGSLQTGALGNTDGYAEYLRAFARQIVDGIWLTGLRIYGNGTEVGLEGKALRPELVPAYINRLKQESVMQGKSFSALQMRAPQAAETRAAEGGRPTVPGHIEFSLQSTDSTMQSAGTTGAQNR